MKFLIKVIAQWFKDRNCAFAIYGADGSCIESANTTPKKIFSRRRQIKCGKVVITGIHFQSMPMVNIAVAFVGLKIPAKKHG